MRKVTRIITLISVVTALAIVAVTMPRIDRSYENPPKQFVTDVILPTTPAKNQGSTPFCWIYAMLATLETDRLAMGDSVNLSAQWTARSYIESQTIDADSQESIPGNATGEIYSGTPSDASSASTAPSSPHSVTPSVTSSHTPSHTPSHTSSHTPSSSEAPKRGIILSGVLPEAFRLIQLYGTMPWDSYNTAPRILPSLKALHASGPCSATVYRRHIERALDTAFGPKPQNVYMLGMRYTPQEFARSIALPGEWTSYVSFAGKPWYRSAAVDVPDNIRHHRAINIPPDSLLRMVYASLDARHPVAWEGDMRPKHAGKTYTPEKLRQHLFESGLLRDQHAMAVIGYGHTPRQRYFIMKNSWGGTGRYYMSETDFVLSTVLVMVKRG